MVSMAVIAAAGAALLVVWRWLSVDIRAVDELEAEDWLEPDLLGCSAAGRHPDGFSTGVAGE